MGDLMASQSDAVLNELRYLFRPSDRLKAEQTAQRISLSWTRDKKRAHATIDLAPQEDIYADTVKCVTWEGRKISLADFLRESALYEPRALSHEMSYKLDQNLQHVPTRIRVLDETGESATNYNEDEACDQLANIISTCDDSRLKVVFVVGAPGAGKTEFLRRLTVKTAQQEKAGFYYFYVDAQGRSLARLNEAIALELDDIGGTLRYQVVPLLTRVRLLVPIIDGFDELLGAAGYKDTLPSFGRFAHEIGAHGTIFVAARTSFYEIYAKQILTLRKDLGFALHQVEVLEWTVAQAKQLVSLRAKKDDRLLSQCNSILDSTPEIAKKPFFVAKLIEVIQEQGELKEKTSQGIISAYLRREQSQKLLDKNGHPLFTFEQMCEFLANVAFEFWMTQLRRIKIEAFVGIVEVFSEDAGLDEEDRAILIDRAPTLACFQTMHGEVQFEHELLFSWAVGRELSSSLSQLSRSSEGGQRVEERAAKDQMAARLVPGVLSIEAATSIVDEALNRLDEGRTARGLLRLLGGCADWCGASSAPRANVYRNVGTIIAVLLSRLGESGEEGAIEGIGFGCVRFEDVEIGKVILRGCTFTKVQFFGVHFRGVQMIDCVFVDSLLSEVTFAGNWKFDVTGLNPGVDITIRRPDGTYLRTPSHVMRELVTKGFKAPPVEGRRPGKKKRERVLECMQILSQKLQRTNMFWIDDDRFKQLVHRTEWPNLLRMLQESGILEIEVRAQSGRPGQVFRVRVPLERVLSGVVAGESEDERIVRLIEKLSSEGKRR